MDSRPEACWVLSSAPALGAPRGNNHRVNTSSRGRTGQRHSSTVMSEGRPRGAMSRRSMIRSASLATVAAMLGVPALAVADANSVRASDLMFAPSVTAPTVSEAMLRKRSVLFELASGSFLPFSALPHVLDKNLSGDPLGRCVVLGEVHDEVQTHAAQLATLEYAIRLPDKRPLVVAFEQFYRMHNPVLDQYISGQISLDAMLKRTAWSSTWGFDAALYTPLFRFCRMNKIRMLGLNVPSQVVSLVVNVGIERLPTKLRELLPDDIDLSITEHRQHFMKAIGFDPATGAAPFHPGTEERMENWYQAQTLWDEYMSESISNVLKEDEDVRVVALVGSGHVETRTAIPDRVERRTGQKPFSIVARPVGWSFDAGFPMPIIDAPERCADVIWYTSRRQDLA